MGYNLFSPHPMVSFNLKSDVTITTTEVLSYKTKLMIRRPQAKNGGNKSAS